MTGRRLGHAFAVLVVALVHSACTRVPEAAVWLELAEEAEFQSGNVTTDLISAVEGVGLDLLDYGWTLRGSEDQNDAYFEMTEETGRVHFFSADGDTHSVEVDAALGIESDRRSLRLATWLNGERIEALRLRRSRASRDLELPEGLVRRGYNILEFRLRSDSKEEESQGLTAVRVRRFRFHTKSGRQHWQNRPEQITNGEGNRSAMVLRMPTASFLDLVTQLPLAARFFGRFVVKHAPGEAENPVEIHLRLVDQEGDEHSLYESEYEDGSDRHHQLELSLKRWQGQVVRFRIGVTGRANAVVGWQQARVEGRAPVKKRLDIEPIGRSRVVQSSRLGRPDVLLILLDAARADAFSMYGSARPTPAVERLAREGTVFARALAPAAWTGQAVPAILTGFYPDSLGYGSWGTPLPAGVPTLAQLFREADYQTVLLSQHPSYTAQDDFRRGFDRVIYDLSEGREELSLSEDLLPEERPTFAFVHLLPPHTPYEPPPPYLGAYSSWYDGTTEATSEFMLTFPAINRPESLPADDLRFIHDRYEENVAFADSLVARFLDSLEKRGRYESSLVVVFSDHGEAFLEHGRFLHTRQLHWEYLEVPLVIKWPHGTGRYAARIEETVSLIDLAPTLVDGLALSGSREGFQGRSLLPIVFDGEAEERPIYAVTRGIALAERAPLPLLMLESGGWKVIHDPIKGESKLYRVEEDPKELRDLAGEQPRLAELMTNAALRQRFINRMMFQVPVRLRETVELPEKLRKQLEALGYVN